MSSTGGPTIPEVDAHAAQARLAAERPGVLTPGSAVPACREAGLPVGTEGRPA